MAELDARPRKTLRGTWDQILARSGEIPGTSDVEVRVLEPTPAGGADPSIALLESWIAQAPTDQGAIQEAEADLRKFKRDMNRPRKETGARLHYPEVE